MKSDKTLENVSNDVVVYPDDDYDESIYTVVTEKDAENFDMSHWIYVANHFESIDDASDKISTAEYYAYKSAYDAGKISENPEDSYVFVQSHYAYKQDFSKIMDVNIYDDLITSYDISGETDSDMSEYYHEAVIAYPDVYHLEGTFYRNSLDGSLISESRYNELIN
jgi:hypothetical protein